MKYNVIMVLLFLLFSCAQEQEFSDELEQKNADARLNHYWDLYEVYKTSMPDSALHYMQEIKILAEAASKKTWVAAAFGAIGDIHRREGRLGEAAFYYLNAIKLFNEQGDLRQLARNYNNLALIYESIEDYENAISYALKAKDIFFYEGTSFNKANNYRNLAVYHSNLKQYKEAEEYVRLAEKVALNAKDSTMLSKTYNTFGIVNFKLKHYDKAREYYHLAMEYSDSTADGLWVKAAATNNIFEAYFYELNYVQAEVWLNKALALKDEMDDPVFLQSTLNLYGEMLVEQEKYREAVDLLQGNFSRAGLSETSPVIDEGLGLIQEALTKIAAENKAENVAYLSRNFAALNTYSREYATQARKLREELQTLSKQLSVQANVEKYAQQEEAEQAARQNLQIILIAVFLLISAVVAIILVMHKNRRYKKLYTKVEDILNSQALRHIKKG